MTIYRYSSQECPRHRRRFCTDDGCRAERNRLDLIANTGRTAAEADPTRRTGYTDTDRS